MAAEARMDLNAVARNTGASIALKALEKLRDQDSKIEELAARILDLGKEQYKSFCPSLINLVVKRFSQPVGEEDVDNLQTVCEEFLEFTGTTEENDEEKLMEKYSISVLTVATLARGILKHRSTDRSEYLAGQERQLVQGYVLLSKIVEAESEERGKLFSDQTADNMKYSLSSTILSESRKKVPFRTHSQYVEFLALLVQNNKKPENPDLMKKLVELTAAAFEERPSANNFVFQGWR